MTPEHTLAESYAKMARLNYEREGELAPILSLHTKERAAICLMKPTDNLPLSYARTMSAAAAVINPDFVITVNEVWMQQVPFSDPAEEADVRARAEAMRRGDLERMASLGDETVRTALMTIAWSMDPTRAVAVVDVVQGDRTYLRHTTVGESEGFMAECIIGGWKTGLALPSPPMPLSDETLVALIGLAGAVVGVLFQQL